MTTPPMHDPTSARYIDTHCHLFWEDFNSDLPSVVERARTAGVGGIIVPSTTLETMQQAGAIAGRFDGVWCTAGVHPHDAAALADDFLDVVRAFALEHRAVAIGEIGLDYHYDFCPRDTQIRVLHAQLALAADLGLPVVLHNRESDDDLYAVCREHQDGSLRGQFHCFSSDAAFAERVLDLGFAISFTGNVTFKKSRLEDAVRAVPDDRLMLETDAPFMAPVPHRGTRNEPSHLPLIAARIAAIRGTTVESIAATTTATARSLFRLGEDAGEE